MPATTPGQPLGPAQPPVAELAAKAARDRAGRRVEQELTVLVRRARGLSEQMAREVHPDLDAAAYGLLVRIYAQEATTVSELAAVLGVGKPTISRQVTALEAMGLLQREPEPGTRQVRLGLTPEGLMRTSAAQQARRSAVRKLLQDWPADDVDQLGVLLSRFNQLRR